MIQRPAVLLCALALLTVLVLALRTPGGSIAGEVSFTYGVLPHQFNAATALTHGPDGRLYVASNDDIFVITLTPDGTGIVGVDDVAPNIGLTLGLAFDPLAETPTLYAAHQESGATSGFRGVISKLTAPDWEREDVITGLPSSEPDNNHFTNGIAFDETGRLFIAQGSATDAGVTQPQDMGVDYWAESPLSAAILVADVRAQGFDGELVYDPGGSPANFDVDLVSGDVSVFASGTRNPYDVVPHSNGLVYATDNGPFGTEHSSGCEQETKGVENQDELNLIEEGNYYGFPNRNRGRTDPRQCVYRFADEPSDADYTAPLAILPDHCSCNGITEYTAGTFGGAMQGDLLFVEWTFGRVRRAQLSEDGRSVTGITTLMSDLGSPLDIVVAPNGIVYVAEYTGDAVSYLVPAGLTPEPTATATLSPTTTPTQEATPTAPPGATSTSTPTPTATRTATTTSTVAQGLLGDVNCNGVVNAIDAALLLQLIAGLVASLPCQDNADADGNGSVNPIDAALILQFDAGLIDQLPP